MSGDSVLLDRSERTAARPLHKIARLLALPWRERLLFVEASLTLVAVRLMLRLTPALTVQRALTDRDAGLRNDAAGSAAAARAESIVRMAWTAAAHQIKASPCLPRALTAQRLLRRRGIEAQLCLGARPADSRPAAHAWLELAGTPILDPHDIALTYARLRWD